MIHASHNRRASFSQLPVALSSSLAPLNSSMIAVALPAIRRDFDVGIGSVTWLVSAYLIGVAVCQPASGRIGDAFGHLRTIKAGLIILAVFSVASVFAWDFPSLVVMRTLQGISGALTMPNAVAYARKHTDAEKLGGVLGTNGAFIAAGASLGPALGAGLLAVGDWRLLFLVNLPIAVVSFILVQRMTNDRGRGRAALKIDLPSLAALLTAFTGITLIGTSLRLGMPGLTGGAVALFVVGVASYVARYRRAGTGVVDLRLFKARNYAVAAAGTALTNIVMYTILIAMPNYLGDLRGLSDAGIGLALFAESIALVLVSPFAGRLGDRLGTRPMMVGGAVILVVAAAGTTLALDGWPLWTIIAGLLLVGLALGLLQPAQQSAALRAHPPETAGSASGTYSMMRYVGSVTGAAMLAAMIGRPATVGQFEAVFAVLTGLAVVNVVIGFLIRVRSRSSEGMGVGEAVPAAGR